MATFNIIGDNDLDIWLNASKMNKTASYSKSIYIPDEKLEYPTWVEYFDSEETAKQNFICRLVDYLDLLDCFPKDYHSLMWIFSI